MGKPKPKGRVVSDAEIISDYENSLPRFTAEQEREILQAFPLLDPGDEASALEEIQREAVSFA